MNMHSHAFLLAMAWVATQAVWGQDRAPAAPAEVLPTKVLISDVPFVSWGEAAQVEYANKSIRNPSLIAVQMMQQRFWGEDPTRFNLLGPRKYVVASWQESAHMGLGKSMDELKHSVARGVPVHVTLTLLPFAHPVSPVSAIDDILGLGPKPSGKQSVKSLSSGAMGRMDTLEALRGRGVDLGARSGQNKAPAEAEFLWLRESMYTAARLLIGYDDERRVVVVHDPSFGPALELGYDDFDTMWRYTGRIFDAGVPQDYTRLADKRGSPAPYPTRTPGAQAAWHFVTGYGLTEVGRTAEAEQTFAKGLVLAGVGPGYRFMLAFEAAHLQLAAGRPEEVVASLRVATAAVPQACAAWSMLATQYRAHPAWPDVARLAGDADSNARRICADPSAMATFAKTVPRDFYVGGLGQLRGWGYDKLGR